MITLTFSPLQIRDLLTTDATDRLGKLLLDALLPATPLSEYKDFIRNDRPDGLNYIRDSLRAQMHNKINHIKMVRTLSSGNTAFLSMFPNRSVEFPCLGLAEAKSWVEANWDKILE